MLNLAGYAEFLERGESLLDGDLGIDAVLYGGER
jgi:hypothetical protein